MKFVLLKIICLLSFTCPFAQPNLTLLNSRPIDANRYSNIKGSPYIFKDWVRATIIPTSGEAIEDVMLNYNGHTQNFEVRQGDRFIELVSIDFIGVRVLEPVEGCENMFFVKYSHPKIRNTYPLFVYNGKKFKLIKDFKITLAENKVETPGKTVKFSTFNDVVTYYLVMDQGCEMIKLNRKNILEALGSPEAVAYVEESKIDLSSETGVCRFLTWLEKE